MGASFRASSIGAERPRPRRARAFTLVELVAVMVLAAVLAASAAPMLGSVASARRGVTLEALRSDVALARSEALASGRRVWVEFDLRAGAWSVLREVSSTSGRAGAEPIVVGGEGRGRGRTIGSDMAGDAQIESADFDGHARVGFDRLGRPWVDDASALTAKGRVRVQRAGAVQVEPVTGHVCVIE